MKRTKQIGLAIAVLALVALIAVPTAAYARFGKTGSNATCRRCHKVTVQRGVPKINFADTVSYAKCWNCHWASSRTKIGEYTHRHGMGKACSSCHAGYGAVTGAYPNVLTAGGYYATSNYKKYTAAKFHGAHVKGSWVADIDPKCASCHAPAACDACHVIPAKHSAHTTTKSGTSPYTPVNAVTAWGTPKNVIAVTAGPTTSTCAIAGCHGVSSNGSKITSGRCTALTVPGAARRLGVGQSVRSGVP
jgi:hypothetical protein